MRKGKDCEHVHEKSCMCIHSKACVYIHFYKHTYSVISARQILYCLFGFSDLEKTMCMISFSPNTRSKKIMHMNEGVCA